MRVALVFVVPLIVAALFGPVPSASADKILFERFDTREKLWVMRSDGSRTHALRSFGAAWTDLSLDGRRLLWSDSSDGSLYTGTITGRDRRLVWRGDIEGFEGPVMGRWSPSRRAIAVVSSVDAPDSDRRSHFQVFVVRPGSRQRRRLRTSSPMSYPSWSPNGRRIVAVGARTERQCTPPPCEVVDHIGLWMIDVATGGAREILPIEGQAAHAAWSPDGRWIAFTRIPILDVEFMPPSAFQVWLVRPDGSGLHQLAQLPGGAQEPSWSPSGRRLAFVTGASGGRTNIATIRADGSGMKLLTRRGVNRNPDWSR